MKKIKIPITEVVLVQENLDAKKFSKKDILENFTKYQEEVGFDYNASPYDKLKLYMDWLDNEII